MRFLGGKWQKKNGRNNNYNRMSHFVAAPEMHSLLKTCQPVRIGDCRHHSQELAYFYLFAIFE
jgi:hypothetical protein